MMIKLPSIVREALLSVPWQCALAYDTDHGPAILTKSSRKDALSMNKRGIIIAVTPQLGLYDTAAVFRIYIEFRDKAHNPMRFDTFLNPAEPDDFDFLRSLANAATLDFYLFDTALNPVGQKRIKWNPKTAHDLKDMIRQALAYNAGLARFNYTESLEKFKEDYPI
jgi:hypothetical protein